MFSIAVVFLLIAATLMSGCSGVDQASATPPVAPPAAVPVETSLATTGAVSATYRAVAALEAEADALAVARIQGEVVAVLVEEGDRVEAGQALARLDTARTRLELKRAEARLKRLETEYARERRLAEARLVSDASLETKAFDIQALEAEVELARLDVAQAVVRAPIDGVVTDRLVKAGHWLERDQAAFRVTDVDDLVATVRMPDASAGVVRVGQPVRLTVDARPGESFGARVDRVSPVVDTDTATVRVTVRVDETAGLGPGMFARLAIVYDRHDDVVLVPSEAVVAEDADRAVFVIENDVATRRPVEVGVSDAGLVEIRRGVEAGQQVVVVGATALKDGTPVLASRG